jgi:hypothetical protein
MRFAKLYSVVVMQAFVAAIAWASLMVSERLFQSLWSEPQVKGTLLHDYIWLLFRFANFLIVVLFIAVVLMTAIRLYEPGKTAADRRNGSDNDSEVDLDER